MKTSKLIITVFSSMLLLQACDSDSNRHKESNTTDNNVESTTIIDVAVDNGSFTTLVAALEATGLDQTLDDPDATFTVFAPTDDAFALLGEEKINSLLSDPDTLSDILSYHVIANKVDANTASAGMTVEMVNGDSVGLSLSGEHLLVNTATVTSTNIQADNGIIHIIDAVLLPPAEMGMPTENIIETAVAAGSFTTLVAALQATGLDAVLADESNRFTVLPQLMMRFLC